MKLSKTHLAILALITTSFIWGAAPPIFKWSLDSIGPFTLGFLRFFFASMFILPLAAKHLRVRKNHVLLILFAAFVSVPLHIGFFLVGLQYAPSINVPIIGAAGPVFIIIASGRLLHERVNKRIIYGTLLSLIGVLAIVLRPIIESGWAGNVTGNFFFLLSTITAIIHLFVIKRLVPHYSPSTITFWTFFLGQLFFLPMMLWEMQQPGYIFDWNTRSAIGILYGALFSSGMAWLFHAFAVKQLPASEIGIFSYLDPITTAVVALPLLGEAITASYLIGGVFVFSGIFIAEGKLPTHPFHRLVVAFKTKIE